MTVIPISPSELLRTFMIQELDSDIVEHIVVGPAQDFEQQAGSISILDMGMPQPEIYLDLARVRHQIRVNGPSMSRADEIAWHCYTTIRGREREIVLQESSGDSYLIHFINVTGGPVTRRDTSEVYEYLIFFEVMYGLDPVDC